MRVGSNPEKFNKEIVTGVYHRIIIPVYIPNFEGYFEDALKIFQLNIESLIITIHDKTRITIYNNNCHPTIKNYINELYEEHDLIDQVFHSKENLGKINAILAGAKGNLEPLITISDSDVMFEHNWQKNVEEVFLNFPKAGLVSPVPNSVAYKIFTANNWFEGILGNSKIRFEKVQDPEEMKMFEESLGPEIKLYKPIHLKKYLVLKNSNGSAVMGAGHFVATIRREVFDKGSNIPAFIKIQGGVENMFIDKPNEDLGLLRLSTKRNYAFHLGNTSESWMQEKMDDLKKGERSNALKDFPILREITGNRFGVLMGKACRKLLLSKSIKEKYFTAIGLEDGEKY